MVVGGGGAIHHRKRTKTRLAQGDLMCDVLASIRPPRGTALGVQEGGAHLGDADMLREGAKGVSCPFDRVIKFRINNVSVCE